MKKRRVQSKIGKLLFHRMGIVAVLIVAQIVLYAAGLVVLRDSVYFDRVEWAVFGLVGAGGHVDRGQPEQSRL